MPTSEEAIQDLLQQLLRQETQVLTAEVTAVNEDQFTCDVKLLRSGVEQFDVRIKSIINDAKDSLILIPEVGSTVDIAMIDDEAEKYAVVKFSTLKKYLLYVQDMKVELAEGEILINQGEHKIKISKDGVQINDGSNGGIAIWPDLKKELEVERSRIDAIINAITNSAVGSSDGGATYKTNMTGVISGLTKADYSQIEDDKATH